MSTIRRFIIRRSGDMVLRTALYNQLLAGAISTIVKLISGGNGGANWLALAEVCQSDISINTAYHTTSTMSPKNDEKHQTPTADPSSVPPTLATGESQSASNIIVSMLVKPAKICPDFKDDIDQVACCESRIDKDSFFCCTRQQKAELQWEMNKAAWRQFAQDHLPSIIIGSLFLVLFFLVLMTFLCKRFPFCPLYRQKSLRSGREIFPQHSHHRYSFATGRYHRPFPVGTACNSLISTSNNAYVPSSRPTHFQQHIAGSIIHKAPAMYEAPPPYEFIAPPLPQAAPGPEERLRSIECLPSRIDDSQPRIHELDYLLDNEINNIHQSIIAENNAAN